MLRYEQIAQNEPKLLALTGLTCREFTDLVPTFQASFERYLHAQTMEGLSRIGRAYTTYRNSPLPTIEDKLLFILVYLKQAPTQTLHGQLFGLSQSNANTWIHVLHAVLNQALDVQGALPARSATINATNACGAATDELSLFSTTAPTAPSTDPAMEMNSGSTIAGNTNSIP